MSWERYYQKNKGRPLRALYSHAIVLAPPTAKIAMDLGCGIGTEVLDLLSRGFEVHAVDQEPQAIELLNSLVEERRNKLHMHLSSLESLTTWPPTDFLFAYHSFPFCRPEQFRAVVDKALTSISTGGIFVASFFGPEDEWVKENKVVGVSAEEVKSKLTSFEILHFEETKKIGPTALEGDKMWNIIDVIARRK